MPGLDGTGPNGEGSMTGRRMGKCNGSRIENNNSNRPTRLGNRRRHGNFRRKGNGFRNGFRGGWD